MIRRIPTVEEVFVSRQFEKVGTVKTGNGQLDLFAKGHTKAGDPFMLSVIEKLDEDGGAITSIRLYLESGFENRPKAEAVYLQPWFKINSFIGEIISDYTHCNSENLGVEYNAQHTWKEESFNVCVDFENVRHVGKVIDFLESHYPVRPEWTNPLSTVARDFLIDDIESCTSSNNVARKLTDVRIAALPEFVRARIETPRLQHHDPAPKTVLRLVPKGLG